MVSQCICGLRDGEVVEESGGAGGDGEESVGSGEVGVVGRVEVETEEYTAAGF